MKMYGGVRFTPLPLYHGERDPFTEEYLLLGSRDSVVGIATSYGLDDRGVGVRVPVGSRMFSSLNHPDRF
jgi:glutamine synthetase